MSQPQDEFGSLDELAIHSNEIFTAHVRAGFTKQQALYMVAAMMTQNPGPAPDDTSDDDSPER